MINPKSLLANLALLGASVATSVLLIEIALRVFLPIPYSMDVQYIPDGHLGTRLRPNMAYHLRSGGTRTVNNLGFRGARDVSPAKARGTVRIVALGGSAAFSSETDDDRLWTTLLETKLRDRYGRHIEVVNAGVPGYSVFESKINYLYRVRLIDPDIVLVYHTWNDLKRFPQIEAGGLPEKGVSRGFGPVLRFLRSLQLHWRIRAFVYRVIRPPQREDSFWRSPGNDARAITMGGRAHEWERKNYEDLALLLASDHVLPVFTSQAGLLSETNLDRADIRAVSRVELVNLSFEEAVRQWTAVSTIIEGVARKHDIPFIDAYDQVPHSRRYFLDHIHLTEEGDARLAAVVFEGLAHSATVDSILRRERRSQP